MAACSSPPHPLSSWRVRTTICDPVTPEIIRGAVRAAQAEMEALLERTAISAFIREKKDFYTALFDADGVMAGGASLRGAGAEAVAGESAACWRGPPATT